MKELTRENLTEAVGHFNFGGTATDISTNTAGHINDTEIITVLTGTGEKRFVLQRVNTDVFRQPVELMENIVNVTGFLREKIRGLGGDPDRETPHVVPAADGKSYYVDKDGNYWRAYDFVENSIGYDRPDAPELFYESGIAFGHFQCLLADYPAGSLHESIPNFHNTRIRFEDFRKAVESDPLGRASEAADDIRFLLARENYADRIAEAHLPLRVCHNDTKLSNVLFDRPTGKAICVIDLDTIMPGSVVIDFGDAIRFGASTAAEDEPDLTKVHFDKNLYDLYLRGFLEGCGGALTDDEMRMLPDGAKIITFEQALRFLGDYILGDIYYHTEHPGQNLDRARTQIRLLEEMEEKL